MSVSQTRTSSGDDLAASGSTPAFAHRQDDKPCTPKRARITPDVLASGQSSIIDTPAQRPSDLCSDGRPLLDGLSTSEVHIIQQMIHSLKETDEHAYRRGLKEGKRDARVRQNAYKTAMEEIDRLSKEKSDLQEEKDKAENMLDEERLTAAAAMSKVLKENTELKRRCEVAERERNNAVRHRLAQATRELSVTGSDSEND